MTIERLFISVPLMVAAALLSMPGAGLCQGVEELEQIGARLDSLVDEMQLVEEVNGLQLSAAEVAGLIEIVDDVQAAVAPIITSRVQVLVKLEPLMRQRRAALIADQQPTDELMGQIDALEGELNDLDVTNDETVVASAPRYRDVLTDAQVSLVTGEEDARRQVVMLVEVMRDMPAEKFNREAPGYAARLENLDADLSARQILDLFAAARNLSPEEYQQQGHEITAGLLAIYAPPPEMAASMMAHFFAHPRMLDILKEKLTAMTNAP